MVKGKKLELIPRIPNGLLMGPIWMIKEPALGDVLNAHTDLFWSLRELRERMWFWRFQ